MRIRHYKPKIPRCIQCQSIFSKTVLPILICQKCLEVKCKNCVSKMKSEQGNKINCPYCLSEVQINSFTVDEQTKQVVEIIEEAKNDMVQRLKNQAEVFKDTLKQQREKFKASSKEFEKQTKRITASYQEKVKKIEEQKREQQGQIQRERNDWKVIKLQNENLKEKVRNYEILQVQWNYQRQSFKKQNEELQQKILTMKVQLQSLSKRRDFWEDDKKELAKVRKELQEQKNKYQQLRQKTLRAIQQDYQALKKELDKKIKSRQSRQQSVESQYSNIDNLYNSRERSLNSSQSNTVFIKKQGTAKHRESIPENNHTVDIKYGIYNEDQICKIQAPQNILEYLDTSPISKNQNQVPIHKQIILQKIDHKRTKTTTEQPNLHKNSEKSSKSDLLSIFNAVIIKTEDTAPRYQRNIASRSSNGTNSQKIVDNLTVIKQQTFRASKESENTKKQQKITKGEIKNIQKPQKNDLASEYLKNIPQQHYWDYSKTDFFYYNNQHYQPGQLYQESYNNTPKQFFVNNSPRFNVDNSHPNSIYNQNYRKQYTSYQQNMLKKQQFYEKDLAKINKILDQYKNNNCLQTQAKNDSIVKNLKERDHNFYFSQEQYYLIANLEKKKAQAQKKLELVIRIRKDEQFPKYRYLEAQVLAYTMQSIRYVDLSCLYLQKIININQLSNLQKLNLSCNYLTNVRVLENNTKLQLLNLQKNNLENLDGLANLTQMTELYLMENRLTQNCYRYLRECPFKKIVKLSVGSSVNEARINDKFLTILLERNSFPTLCKLRLNPQKYVELRAIVEGFNKRCRKNNEFLTIWK